MLKLCNAVYGLHQAPVKFKQEVTAWFKDKGYMILNPISETVWIKRLPGKSNQTNAKGNGGVIMHAYMLIIFFIMMKKTIWFCISLSWTSFRSNSISRQVRYPCI